MKRFSIQTLQIAFVAVFLTCPGVMLSGQVKQPAGAPSTSPGAKSGKMGLETAELLRKLDKDHDGFTSQKEWDAFFFDHDQNGDWRLSPEEIQAISTEAESEESLGPDYGRLAAFERLDKNKNNAVESSEWPGKAKDFSYLDSNHDGSLSREEFLAKNGRWWNETFENLDFNGDKVIVRSEWLDSDASFDRLDRDHNGTIDRREFYNPR
jgi:hypothetical protein